jgi:two-component system, OmpR family, sensor histidine kinase KdpD
MATPTVVALLLLLAVLCIAAVATRRVAIPVSVVAALVLNFFFLPPIGTLSISDPQHSIVWFVFLAVTLVGSHLATAARSRAAEAIAQRDELARLLEEREAGEAAKRRAELATALLNSMGHDLRTPLTAIEVAAANLQDAGIPEALRAEQAEILRGQVARLTRVFDRIIAMARIDAGVLRAEPEWVHPGDIVEAAVQEVEPALVGHAVHTDAPDGPLAFVDPRLTSTALARVLENAARHAPGLTPIAITASVTGGELRITVDDEGPGIPEGDLPRLFDPFYRAASRHTDGLGMGLAIARGLLVAQHGRITAENRSPRGARFSIVVGKAADV